MMDVIILILEIISQCLRVSAQPVVHFKYTQLYLPLGLQSRGEGKESRKEGGRKETGKSHRAEGTPLRTDIAQSLILLERGEHTGSSCLAQGGTVPPTSPYKCL